MDAFSLAADLRRFSLVSVYPRSSVADELWLTGGAVGSGGKVLLEELGGGFEKVVGGYDAY